MFRDRTEPTLFRAGTVPETVPVRSLFVTVIYCMLTTNILGAVYENAMSEMSIPDLPVYYTNFMRLRCRLMGDSDIFIFFYVKA